MDCHSLCVYTRSSDEVGCEIVCGSSAKSSGIETQVLPRSSQQRIKFRLILSVKRATSVPLISSTASAPTRSIRLRNDSSFAGCPSWNTLTTPSLVLELDLSTSALKQRSARLAMSSWTHLPSRSLNSGMIGFGRNHPKSQVLKVPLLLLSPSDVV